MTGRNWTIPFIMMQRIMVFPAIRRTEEKSIRRALPG
jgi:hypothetical protein